MKWIIFLCIVHMLALVVGSPLTETRGCIYILGKCQKECEEGTHSYTTGCAKKMPEATCSEPNPRLEEFAICDYSACYCDAPTVRDMVTGKCVKVEDCSTQHLEE